MKSLINDFDSYFWRYIMIAILIIFIVFFIKWTNCACKFTDAMVKHLHKQSHTEHFDFGGAIDSATKKVSSGIKDAKQVEAEEQEQAKSTETNLQKKATAVEANAQAQAKLTETKAQAQAQSVEAKAKLAEAKATAQAQSAEAKAQATEESAQQQVSSTKAHAQAKLDKTTYANIKLAKAKATLAEANLQATEAKATLAQAKTHESYENYDSKIKLSSLPMQNIKLEPPDHLKLTAYDSSVDHADEYKKLKNKIYGINNINASDSIESFECNINSPHKVVANYMNNIDDVTNKICNNAEYKYINDKTTGGNKYLDTKKQNDYMTANEWIH
jgi:hypothetical protein